MILQICLVRRYVLVMSLTHFRVNPHSIVASTSRTPCSKLKWNLKCLSVRLQTMWFSCSHLNFRFPAWFEQEFLDVQATIECGFTLKCVREMTRTYIQMHRTDKYSQILRRPVWINGWVFVYELNGCGFKSRYCHILVGLYGFIGNKVLLRWRKDNTIALHKVYPCRKVNTTEFIHIRLYENMTFFKKHGVL